MATTVPVPGWPGLGAYPGSVLITTTLAVSPERVAPALLIELDAITAMNWGTVAGESELLPDWVVQLAPQVAGLPAEATKPLKAVGAGPPLSALSFDHCVLQNVTPLPTVAFRSPIAKDPLASFVNQTLDAVSPGSPAS